MAGENGLPNGHDAAPAPETQEAPLTLREIAEQSYSDLEAGEGSTEPAVDERDDGRDKLGRFTSKPGEQSAPTDPAPIDIQAPPAQPTDPARPPTESNQAPANWSETDRQMFGALPKEGQAFLLRRHTEMEGDYTRRAQSAATAIGFTQALTPVFTDPVISRNLQEQGVNPAQAIHEWANMHRRAIDPDPNVRMGLLRDIAQRVGIDPATIGNPSQPALPPGMTAQDMADPAIRFFADQAAKQAAELAGLRQALDGVRQNAQQQAEDVAVRTARVGIDEFAEQKDANGRPLHPYFDEVIPAITDLFRLNPQRDLREAYETACWQTPTVRAKLIADQQAAATRHFEATKARQGQRANTRGVTSPVSKPNPLADGKPKSLREIAEASADEIGF